MALEATSGSSCEGSVTAEDTEDCPGIGEDVMMEAGDEEDLWWSRRSVVAMWLLGLLNNSIFVILNAGATYILPAGVGVIYLCNNLPNLLVVGTGPYWFHLVRYKTRVTICTICFAVSVTMVAVFETVWVRLLGVMIGSFAQGLGESSMLALTSFYSRAEITGWSSGTGFAGIFGYAFKAFFVDFSGLSFNDTLLLSNSLPCAFFIVFTYFLKKPEEVQSTFYVYQEIRTNDGSQLDEEIPTSPKQMLVGFWDKVHVFRKLWPFTVPLFVVYVAEYSMQSGTWAAFGFPIHDRQARDKFYLYSNWLYQVGVFFSRSSGEMVTLTIHQLWALPLLQVLLLVFFIFDGIFHFWWGNSVLVLCLLVGCLGGAVYVHTFCMMSKMLPQHEQEFSMAAASVAATGGTALSNLLGVVIQGCLYGINKIVDEGPPLFLCGFETLYS